MGRKSKSLIAGFTVIMLCLASAPSQADPHQEEGHREQPSYDIVMLDLLVARPLGLATSALGGALFTATLPMTIWGGEEHVTTLGNIIVIQPAAFTFTRPWGEFDTYTYHREHHGFEEH